MTQTQFVASLIVLAIIGIIDASYLAWHSIRKKPLVCPLNDTCDIVVEGKWSMTFGIKNEFLGLAYYISVLIAAFIIAYYNTPFIIIGLPIASGLALLFSIFLVYLQAKVIKQYCFYCMISAIVSLLIFLNTLLILV